MSGTLQCNVVKKGRTQTLLKIIYLQSQSKDKPSGLTAKEVQRI